MSKRRRNKTPNVPKATLDRARKQAGIEPQEESDTPEAETSSRRRKVTPANLERSRQRGELTNEMISAMLANPTVAVTEAQLRKEYQHVLFDLRNMGILTAVLMVLMVALAQFI